MNIIFLGAPGVGKGTYASRVAPVLNIAHISTGDLFRYEIANETELGLRAKEYMDRGELVPDELVIDMLKDRIDEEDCNNGFILDGFPRTIKQAEELEKAVKIDLVVNIILKKEILIQKLSARRVCSKCGDIYNIADINIDGLRMPPMLPKKENTCDKCGGSLYQRDDDHAEVIEERFAAYEKQTKPLIVFYEKKGILKNLEVVGAPDIMLPKVTELINKGA